ncbi:YesK family protein [Lederbergia lenta]|uniref:YesK-like protein n=1 Tax=Lederbergia lenta TaxID=1467 RepID=A0A2X4WIH7_LEDLE|nr:YesK family protein [Lederbergia lenta]MCM3109540.1 hypothetical protein [Lederbergia lenta]MEC2324706.1 YesK family protein [Lederbergia lenta]SQI58512.1 Uncharacterised protein [Lederbergia lenta]
MMLYVPIGIGLIIGIVTIVLTRLLVKFHQPKFLMNSPGILTLLAAVGLFYVGLSVVRGFEGAAYLILAIIISICAVISLITGNLKKTN